MRKEKIYTAITAIGFFGVMAHPVMIVVLAIGVIGLNVYHNPATDEQV